MKSKLLIIGSSVLFLIILLVYFYQGTLIETIQIDNSSPFEQTLNSKLLNCLEVIKGKSFLFLSDTEISALSVNCDQAIIGSVQKSDFPNKYIVIAKYINPSVKVEDVDDIGGCTIYESALVKQNLSADRCINYSVVTIKGQNIPRDLFRVEFLIYLVELSSKYNLQFSKIEEKGDSSVTWYEITMKEGTLAYMPQNANTEEKVASLSASIMGLKSSNEKYKLIDLRFDRVIYR